MECTQRLECTQQEIFQTERESPEQIGFLGICGNKYPVKKGPNKIGRDSNTCNIVLNLNSVSRQHAVINILNSKEFMLMDLDSANKTKLLGKTLLPYMPQPLKDGDMVQFGEVFGIFRLLKEQSELLMTQALPMTQPIHIPDTPLQTKHMSKLNPATTIPESPDVSDKDDSYIIASQPKGHTFKSSNTHFIKPGKTISIQPIGGNKIDNVYWNSSRKSTSLNLDDSTSSHNDSIPFVRLSEKENEANAGNIHEIDTQVHHPIGSVPIHDVDTQDFPLKVIKDSIYEANTQVPDFPIPDSIYTAETQLPGSSIGSPSIRSAETKITDKFHSPSIYSQETQVLPGKNLLLVVCQMNKQQDVQFDVSADKDNSIYTAETQMFPESPVRPKRDSNSPSNKKPNENSKLDKSDIVLFDDIDNQTDDDNFESQTILTEDILLPINKYIEVESQPLSQITLPKSSKRNMRIRSDSSSTDCEEIDDDILPTQKIPEKERKVNDKNSTDCEDEMIELKVNEKPNNTAEKLDLEDVATQVIDVLETPPGENDDVLTQVIYVAEVSESEKPDNDDLPTQVIAEDNAPMKRPVKAQLVSDEVEISPFKIPLQSVLRAKKKDVSRTPKIKAFANIERKSTAQNDDDDKYYQATQDIYLDLCSQTESSSDVPKRPSKLLSGKRNNMLSPQSDVSPNNSDVEDKIKNFVSTLNSQEIREVIGVEKVAPVKKVSSLGSDNSDLELTPKKVRPFTFMDTDLPNSQEIKTSVSLSSKAIVTESSSDSENEQNSEDQCTPILFHKKKKSKRVVKMDLTKKFDVEALPTRVITRVRKPTAKVRENEGKKITESILKPKFLTEQDDDVNEEIITENITKLKNKNEKSKSSKDTIKVTKLDETKNNNITKQLKETKKQKNQDKSTNPDEIKNLKKETVATVEIKTENDKTKQALPKSDEINKKEIIIKRESKRKTKSASPVNDSKDNVNRVTEISVQSSDTSKSVENVDISKEINNKTIQTMDSKCNAKTAPAKTKEEKPRGPIMIEPHTITVPVKEEKSKKREYKRKNKEPANKNMTKQEWFSSLDLTSKTKSETMKVDKIEVTESKRPVRSTRSRKKQSVDVTDPTESQTDSQDQLKQTKKSKELSPDKEVRRSKRQRVVKEKEEKEQVPRSILKKNTTMHEQSTVYNMSGSGAESPSLKRTSEFEAPLPKRTRSAVNASLRATPARAQKTCYVLFTAFPYEEVKLKLEKLGAVVVTDVIQCTVLLTLQIKRTFKLLCAVGLGKPIVGPNWVQACSDSNMIVDPWLYIIKDQTAEQRFRFTLQRTLTGTRNFLQGYNLSSTPSVLPQPSEMKLIVQCSGGNWQEGGPRWLCLSNGADRALWPEMRKRGATLVTTELILGGVLQQRLDIKSNTIKIQ